ncbi:MAG: hypothetical protein WBP64_04950 [Nitrososphaeraceae archaeon]
MTTNEILPDLENKGFYQIVNKIKKLTAMDQLNLELECTGYLKDLVDYANKHMLKGFRLRLVMEEV